MNILAWIVLIIICITILMVLYDSLNYLRRIRQSHAVKESVRVAVIHGNKVLLTHVPTHHARMQHPLYIQLRRGETKEKGVQRLMSTFLPGIEDRPKFLLKYLVDQKDDEKPTKVVYLYVLNLPSEDYLDGLIPDGTYLDCNTIDRYAEESRVSPSFMEEFAYLRNTVILCNRLLSRKCPNK